MTRGCRKGGRGFFVATKLFFRHNSTVPLTNLARTAYRKLIVDIADLYDGARKSQILFCWQTGKRIVDVEQDGALRAAYGSGLLQKLSDDLSAKYGQGAGFSINNLERMRKVYLLYPKSPPAGILTWSQHVELLTVKDEKARLRLVKRAVTQGLNRNELRDLVQKQTGYEKSAPDLPPLKRPTDLCLNTCRMADPGVTGLWKLSPGQVLFDCGFFVFHPDLVSQRDVLVTDNPSFTYAAVVERVVDGDTLLVLIHVGFGNVVRERLRLRGINTPELGTPEGEKAKKYVSGLLPPGSAIVIKTYRTDDYGRFVVDVFFRAGEAATEEIMAGGVYLNQHLLDESYAVRMAE